MNRKFIAFEGHSHSGKTMILNWLIEEKNAVKFFPGKTSQRAVVRLKDKVVFIRTSSPQERNNVESIKKDFEFFEKYAIVFGLETMIVLMAFTNNHLERIEEAKRFIIKEKHYEYDTIYNQYTTKIPSEQELKSKYMRFLETFLVHRFLNE